MVECPECNNEYKQLGQHWVYSDSHRPQLTQKQLEITKGLVMGDGYIHNRDSRLIVRMVSPNYLEYLDKIFGCLGCGVSLVKTAADSAKENRNSGFSPSAREENYSDVYSWGTRKHPKFNEFRQWYSTGEKIWPEDIKLTPTVLKHWYVGDGSYFSHGSNKNIKISMANEIKNTEKVSNYFSYMGLPEPSNYSKNKRKSGGKRCVAQWTIEDSYKLWDYMGEPLPDFEYKWPKEYR